jgi:hypothetical protein
MVHSHADRRKLRRENTSWTLHPKSYIAVYRMMDGKTSHSIHQLTIEWSNDWIQIGVNTGKRNFHMSVYPWSAQNRFKLMSRVADLVQPTDLMERYETFLWTQIIQFFQPIAE